MVISKSQRTRGYTKENFPGLGLRVLRGSHDGVRMLALGFPTLAMNAKDGAAIFNLGIRKPHPSKNVLDGSDAKNPSSPIPLLVK
jgi:hypothetical protein